jgi:hypothetical protein
MKSLAHMNGPSALVEREPPDASVASKAAGR